MTANNLKYTVMSKSSVIVGSISLTLFFHFVLFGSFNYFQFKFTVFESIIFNTLLASVYFTQHSLMIRNKFRSKIENHLPKESFYSFHSLTSGTILGINIIFWQQVDFLIYSVSYPFRFVSYILTLMAIFGLIWAIYSLSNFDPFGRKQIRNYLNNKKDRSQEFVLRGPYKFTRHPFYFFILAMIWLHPSMTVDRLVFAILWSCWVILGTILEEKDLVAEIGEDYIRYQSTVPMLVPYKFMCNIKS